MKTTRDEFKMALMMIGIFIIVLMTIGWFTEQPTEVEAETLSPACLRTYANLYCDGPSTSDNTTFQCINKNREREGVKELSTKYHFTENELTICTYLNFRETGR